ncbi:MAG: HAD family hydrolase [SAR202 cluster bacterium]|nr:HAD family hydrolase [SAR202 cluster bacterium]
MNREDVNPGLPRLRRPRAILFDVYDTLFINGVEEWVGTFERICRAQSLQIGAKELWTHWKRIEVGFRQRRTNLADPSMSPPFKSYAVAWTECFAQTFKELGLKGDASGAAQRSVTDMSKRPIFEDTKPALAALRPIARLGVFSNADDAFLRPLLGDSRLEFEVVASSESAAVYKPATAAFHHLAGLMKVETRDAWYVGDQLHDDVLGARSVGMVAIWINRKHAPRGHDGPVPDATIDDLRQLTVLLDRST